MEKIEHICRSCKYYKNVEKFHEISGYENGCIRLQKRNYGVHLKYCKNASFRTVLNNKINFFKFSETKYLMDINFSDFKMIKVSSYNCPCYFEILLHTNIEFENKEKK